MGELTGEMGTVATFDRSTIFFQRRSTDRKAAARKEPCRLRRPEHDRNADGIWPLEFNCRFRISGLRCPQPTAACRRGATLSDDVGHSQALFIAMPRFFSGHRVDDAALSLFAQGGAS